MNANIFPTKNTTAAQLRLNILRQNPAVYWFVGLSGAGKTTITQRVEQELLAMGKVCYVLDGDNIRKGLSNDLRFSAEDRTENLRRVAEAAKLFLDAGIICLAAFITPMESDRSMIRSIIGAEQYNEVYVHCPLETCEQRDPKGLYRLARANKIPDFTGISAPFEEPMHSSLRLDTSTLSVEECVRKTTDLISTCCALS